MRTSSANIQSGRTSGLMPMPIRRLHAWIGMLIAPAVLFLATTGLLQIYGLHEDHPGYTSPALFEMLSAIHQHQGFGIGDRHEPDEEHSQSARSASGPPPSAEAPHEEKRDHFNLATSLLKAFFAFVATGLIFSTSLGIWMALQQTMSRRTYVALLIVGTFVPAILAALTM